MTPQDELERIVDLSGLRNVLTLLAVICGERAVRSATLEHDTAAAKDWAKQADAIDAVIIKLWGRL